MTSTQYFEVNGVVAVWSGNEAALTIANPAIQLDDRVASTRGENWTFPQDLSQSDVSDLADYVPVDPIDIPEGYVAWLAGPAYVSSYEALLNLEPTFTDWLEIDSWQQLPEGWLIHFDSAARFYEVGASVATKAHQTYAEALVSGQSAESELVAAARRVFVGSPGIARGTRRTADAVWYSLTGDYELYSRSLRLAARALETSESEIKDRVENEIEFYRARVAVPQPESFDEMRNLQIAVENANEKERRTRERFEEAMEVLKVLVAAVAEYERAAGEQTWGGFERRLLAHAKFVDPEFPYKSQRIPIRLCTNKEPRMMALGLKNGPA